MKKVFALLLALAMLLSLAACGQGSDPSSKSGSASNGLKPEEGASSSVEGEPSAVKPEGPVCDVTAEELVGNSYEYEETTEMGFAVTWTLTFDDESNATLVEGNDMMGDTTYTATWQFVDGQIQTEIVESSGSMMPISTIFDSENNYAATWIVSGGQLTPISSYESSLPDLPGGVPSGETASNADYPSVAYASQSASQVLDIYLPEGDGPHPVIVVVHGGGFAFGSQTMEIIQPVIETGLANGYAMVSVDYRKSSEAPFPAALADVKAAVRFVRANAEEYGFDADHIAIWGESAGAYLSVMTALTANVDALNGDVTENAGVSSEVAALVDFYGPIEFYVMDDEYAAMGIESSFATDSSFESKFVGQNVGADKEFTYTTYWETYKDQFTNTDLYAWIQAGDADTSVPCTESVNLAERLSALLGEDHVKSGLIEGAAHEDPLFYTDENLAQVFKFLDGVMK